MAQNFRNSAHDTLGSQVLLYVCVYIHISILLILSWYHYSCTMSLPVELLNVPNV